MPMPFTLLPFSSRAQCRFNGNLSPIACFHSSVVMTFPRITRDRNPDRGTSPIHRRLKIELLGAEKHIKHLPIFKSAQLSEIQSKPKHGLWGFFHSHKALPTPEDDHKHGRAWSVEELRHKSWDDLHKLWWKCVLERNVIETQTQERMRIKPGYGEHEANERNREVKWTQRAIKHSLTERYYAWQAAHEIAKQDLEVNLSGNGHAYNPISYMEEDDLTASKSFPTGSDSLITQKQR